MVNLLKPTRVTGLRRSLRTPTGKGLTAGCISRCKSRLGGWLDVRRRMATRTCAEMAFGIAVDDGDGAAGVSFC